MTLNTEGSEQSCLKCGETIAVAAPPPELKHDPHWAESYPQRDDRYMVCWTCGKVMWME